MNPPHRRDDMAGPHREISMGQMRRDDIGPVRRDDLGPGRRDEMGGGAYAVAGPSGLRAHGAFCCVMWAANEANGILSDLVSALSTIPNCNAFFLRHSLDLPMNLRPLYRRYP